MMLVIGKLCFLISFNYFKKNNSSKMIRKNYRKFLSFIFVGLLISTCILANNTEDKLQDEEILNIFLKFENGMSTGAVKEFSSYFSFETYISLESGVSSYFGSDQSYYILKEFLSNYKPIRFKFIRVDESAEMPFAVGQFSYSLNGMRGTSQVFVSLKSDGSQWKISQITIN